MAGFWCVNWHLIVIILSCATYSKNPKNPGTNRCASPLRIERIHPFMNPDKVCHNTYVRYFLHPKESSFHLDTVYHNTYVKSSLHPKDYFFHLDKVCHSITHVTSSLHPMDVAHVTSSLHPRSVTVSLSVTSFLHPSDSPFRLNIIIFVIIILMSRLLCIQWIHLFILTRSVTIYITHVTSSLHPMDCVTTSFVHPTDSPLHPSNSCHHTSVYQRIHPVAMTMPATTRSSCFTCDGFTPKMPSITHQSSLYATNSP